MPKSSVSTHDKTRTHSKSFADIHQPSWAFNAARQLKLILPGAALTWYLGIIAKFKTVLQKGDGSFQSKLALAAFGSVLAMITLFLCILFLVFRKGEQPDWRTWRRSGSLSTIIPALTTTIIVGWVLHVIVLGKWTDLGYVRGIVGAGSLYGLIFGLLGLIPAPRKPRDT